jgi:hypothetical protein
MSALPPSAAIVRAVKQIDLAPYGNVSMSFSAALNHETGRVLRVIDRWLLQSSSTMLSNMTTDVKNSPSPREIRDCCVLIAPRELFHTPCAIFHLECDVIARRRTVVVTVTGE